MLTRFLLESDRFQYVTPSRNCLLHTVVYYEQFLSLSIFPRLSIPFCLSSPVYLSSLDLYLLLMSPSLSVFTCLSSLAVYFPCLFSIVFVPCLSSPVCLPLTILVSSPFLVGFTVSISSSDLSSFCIPVLSREGIILRIK